MHRYVVSTTANGLCQGTCAAFIQPVWAHRSPAEDFGIPRRPQARVSQHDSVRTTKAGNLNRIVPAQKQYIPYYQGEKSIRGTMSLSKPYPPAMVTIANPAWWSGRPFG